LQPYFFPVLTVTLRPQASTSRRRLWIWYTLLLLLGSLLVLSFYRVHPPINTSQIFHEALTPLLLSPPDMFSVTVASRGSDGRTISTPSTPPYPSPDWHESPIKAAPSVGLKQRPVDRRTSHSVPKPVEIPRLSWEEASAKPSGTPPKSPLDSATTDMRLRARAFASFASMRVQRLYDEEMHHMLGTFRGGLSHIWELCTTIWNWPLPP
jgi:hypothetical protein